MICRFLGRHGSKNLPSPASQKSQLLGAPNRELLPQRRHWAKRAIRRQPAPLLCACEGSPAENSVISYYRSSASHIPSIRGYPIPPSSPDIPARFPVRSDAAASTPRSVPTAPGGHVGNRRNRPPGSLRPHSSTRRSPSLAEAMASARPPGATKAWVQGNRGLNSGGQEALRTGEKGEGDRPKPRWGKIGWPGDPKWP